MRRSRRLVGAALELHGGRRCPELQTALASVRAARPFGVDRLKLVEQPATVTAFGDKGARHGAKRGKFPDFDVEARQIDDHPDPDVCPAAERAISPASDGFAPASGGAADHVDADFDLLRDRLPGPAELSR